MRSILDELRQRFGLEVAIDLALRNAGAGAGPTGDGVTYMTGLNPFLSLYALLNPRTYPRATAGTYSGLSKWMLETPVTF